jgi:hypothetical protein
MDADAGGVRTHYLRVLHSDPTLVLRTVGEGTPPRAAGTVTRRRDRANLGPVGGDPRRGLCLGPPRLMERSMRGAVPEAVHSLDSASTTRTLLSLGGWVGGGGSGWGGARL